MILFYNSSGELIKSSPERVFQGANKANDVYFCCPTGEGNLVNVAYSLPNGTNTAQYVLYPLTGGINLPEVLDVNGAPFKVWHTHIPYNVTATCGNVSMQFYLTCLGEVVATETFSFVVEKGVLPSTPPTEGDAYQQLLDYFVSFREFMETEYNNFKNSVNSVMEMVDNTITKINNDYVYQVEDNVNKINMLIDLSINKNEISKASTEENFIARDTAGGLNVVDGSPAIVNKISGATVKSKNIFDISKITNTTYTAAGVSGTLTNNGDGSITFDQVGWGVYTTKTLQELCPTLQVGDTFNFTGRMTDSGGDKILDYIQLKGDNNYSQIIFAYNSNSSTKYYTATQQMLDAILGFYTANDTTKRTVYDLQIELGTTATSYQPYYKGLKNAYFEKIVSTGKNLLDIDSMVGSALVKNADGSYTITKNGNTRFSKLINCRIPSGEYRPSAIISGSVDIGIRGCLANGKEYSMGFHPDQAVQSPYSVSSDIVSIQLYLGATQTDGTSVTFSNPMINKGSTALTYEPYKQSECSVENTIELKEWDYIEPQTGNLVVGTETLTFDGTEDWELLSIILGTRPNVPCFRHRVALPSLILAQTSYSAVSNYYETWQSSAVPASQDRCVIMNGNWVYIRDSRYETVTEFKAHLVELANSGNRLEIAYKLATPTTTNVAIEKSFVAYSDGVEGIIQNATDNSKDGANPMTEIEYFVLGAGE